MAEKRMLSKVISISKKVNLRMPDHFSRLLYTWLIPHSDDYGRLTGCPYKIKALVIPMLTETWEEVKQALQNMDDAELIQWYTVDGEQYIQINNFEDHQSGLHKRTTPKIPEPPNISRKFPEIPLEEKGTEGNRREGKRMSKEEEKTALLSQINRIGLQTKGAFELDNLYSYLGVMEYEVILDAINRSEKQKKLSYALGILSDRNSKRLFTISDLVTAGEITKPKNDHGELDAQREKQKAESRTLENITYEPAEELRSVVNG